jgi:hypothetical protein
MQVHFCAGIGRWGAMLDCRDRIYNDRGSDCIGATLLFWLEIIRHAVATDPRDKIYSVLGLLERFADRSPSDFDPSFLSPDYSLCTGRLF